MLFNGQMQGARSGFVPIDIERALDTTTSSGQALHPTLINPYLQETATALSALRNVLPRKPWRGRTYDANKRTALPRGFFVGDNTIPPENRSTYVRFQETLKMLQGRSGVTTFQQFASQMVIDSFQAELTGALLSCMYEEEYGVMWGNPDADAYEFKGLDYYTTTGNAYVKDANGASATTAMLDAILDNVGLRAGGVAALNAQSAFWLMSPMAVSYLSSTQDSKQKFENMVTIDGGLRLRTYRGVPIVETGFTQGNQSWTGSTVTGTDTSANGGSYAANTTYRYYVAAVLQTGETLPSSEVSVTTANDGNNAHTITLAWSAPSVANSVRHYVIYRTAAGGASGAQVRFTVIPGVVQSADSTWGIVTAYDVTTWVDKGVRNAMTTTANTPTGYATVTGALHTPGYATSSFDELAANEEDVFLCVTNTPVVQGEVDALGGNNADNESLHMAVGIDLQYMPLAKLGAKESFLVYEIASLIGIDFFLGRCTRMKMA